MVSFKRLSDAELQKEFKNLSIQIASAEYECLQFRFGGFGSVEMLANREGLELAKKHISMIKEVALKRGILLSL